MEKIVNWKEILFNSFQAFGESLMSSLPGIIGALLLLLIGWMIAKFVAYLTSKLLTAIKFDILTERQPFADYYEKSNIETKPSVVIKKLVYWVVMLIFIITASETLGLTVISAEISNLINYIPKLFSAIVLFVVGVYIITFIRDFIKSATASLGISTGKLISGFVFYLLFVIVTLTSLKQAGVDTSIITSNLTLIIGAILLAASVSYGIASKDILSNILAGFFSRKTFAEGQKIEVNDCKGTITEINSISVKLKTEEGEVIVPTHELINNKVKILNA